MQKYKIKAATIALDLGQQDAGQKLAGEIRSRGPSRSMSW